MGNSLLAVRGINHIYIVVDKKKDCTVSEKDLETIVKFIESVKFGSISIIIQDGRIVQIEKNEKVRG